MKVNREGDQLRCSGVIVHSCSGVCFSHFHTYNAISSRVCHCSISENEEGVCPCCGQSSQLLDGVKVIVGEVHLYNGILVTD